MAFQRTNLHKYKKLNRKSKLVYRKARGRHNKIREKRKGKPVRVEIGYRARKRTRGLIDGKKLVVIRRIEDLINIKEENIIVLGKIGKKKKIEIAKKTQEKGINILNLNIKKFLKKIQKEKEYKKKLKEEKEGKKKKKEAEKKTGEKKEDKTEDKDKEANK